MQKPNIHSILPILIALALPAGSAMAQDANPTTAPAQPAPFYAPPEDSNPGDAIYDPTLINPEISKSTTSKTQSARTILERTHQPPISNFSNLSERHMQSLPGEEQLDQAIEQITELNEIKPGPAITLREALLMADRDNLNLAAARVKIEIADAQLKQAWAILLPNISGSLSYAHVYNNATASSLKSAISPAYESLGNLAKDLGQAATSLAASDPALAGALGQMAQDVASPLQGMQSDSGSSNAIDTVSMGLTVGLSIVNVANWFKLRMADEAVDITELGVEDGRQQILAGVAQAYMAALLCGEVVKVQRVQLKTALDQLTVAQGRFDRGADVKLSVIQAQFSVEQQRQALIDAIWSYETTRDALANLINIKDLPVPQPTHLKSVDLTDDDKLVEDALQNNRTLKINRMTQHVNELNLNAAIADFFPTLSGAFQFGYTLHPQAGSPTWTMALSASVPLFDYSKFGVLDERKASILETQLSMESTAEATRIAVRKAKREYNSSLFNVDNAKRQVELAREALQLTEASYKNGASTFIDVSRARDTVAAASIAYITAAIQSELSMISLISTLGRDIMEVVY